MKEVLARHLKCYTVIFLIMVLLFMICSPALAETKSSGKSTSSHKSRVLKVAFPSVPGMSETDENGTHHGLVVDYLNEIAKYTGWEYEYVPIDDVLQMFEDFKAGKYDLLGGQYYVNGLENQYGYPDFNTGYSRSCLLARKNDRSIRSNDIESMNGKTIGVYEKAEENIRRLKEFLTFNGIKCTIKEYSFEELGKDGTLYAYLENGDVDLLLGNAQDRDNDLRLVVSYDSQPFYIVTTPDNKEVLDGLNMAMERITDANPNFGKERYEANFHNTDVDIQLTDEEIQYVKGRDAVTVAVPKTWHPLFCNNIDDLHNGRICWRKSIPLLD